MSVYHDSDNNCPEIAVGGVHQFDATETCIFCGYHAPDFPQHPPVPEPEPNVDDEM